MLPGTRAMFEDTPEGQRRSVYFALGVATGFIAIVAATGALLQSSSNSVVAAVLIILAAAAFAFAALTAMGRFGWLYQAEEAVE